jgi:hypothetical protein
LFPAGPASPLPRDSSSSHIDIPRASPLIAAPLASSRVLSLSPSVAPSVPFYLAPAIDAIRPPSYLRPSSSTGTHADSGRFEDAPSPVLRPPYSRSNVLRPKDVPAEEFSPKPQSHIQGAVFRRPEDKGSGGDLRSPAGAASIAASLARLNGQGRESPVDRAKPVEDRLQALLDRLATSRARREEQARQGQGQGQGQGGTVEGIVP